MTSETRPGRVSRRLLLALLLLIVLGAGGFLAWKWLAGPGSDMTAALEANTRGVGYMDRFEYAQAVTAFEEAARAVPDWVPARINLSLALLNQAGNTTEDGKEQSQMRRNFFGRAIRTSENILKTETDPHWLAYAHYALGVIYLTAGEIEKARPHFEKTVELDPQDPHSLYRLGQTLETSDSKRAAEYFLRATKADPYLGSAVYAYFNNTHVRAELPEQERKRLSDDFVRMNELGLYNSSRDRYSELGHYGTAIGRFNTGEKPKTVPPPLFLSPEHFTVELAANTRWASRSDFAAGPVKELVEVVGKRYGGVMVLLDYDRDGRIDILLLGAVLRDGKPSNLLLHNEGGGKFVDRTKEAGLVSDHVSLGCSVADFDNDTFPDLLLTGVGGVRLYRNKHDGTFEDVTTKAGLDKIKGVTLGSMFVDLDQDGDLDLVIANWGDSPKTAMALLAGKGELKSPGLLVFANNGLAFPVLTSKESLPLSPSFVPIQRPAFEPSLPVTGFGLSDVDLDLDLDLILFTDGKPAELILNDRLLRFRRESLPASLLPPGTWNGAVVLDVDRDERSDLLVIGPGQSPQLLMHEPVTGAPQTEKLYRKGRVRSPALLQAQAIDLDLDGHTDVVGLSANRLPVFLRNEGDHLADAPTILGEKENWPADLLAVATADMDGDGLPDVVAWSEEKGLQLRVQQKNNRKGLYLEVTGHRRVEPAGNIVRCNADGIGVQLSAQVRDHWTGLEYGSLCAGLGQSRTPLVIGLGTHSQAELVRLRWPDNCWQAEFNIAVGRPHQLHEQNKKGESCPVLFTWNGERFVFVTDFLGAGTLGETQPDSSYRMPRPEESVKVEAHQLQPKDGVFVLKVAEPMNEVTYLDRLQLLVVDHPASASVYPDERMATEGPQPSQDLLSFDKPLFAVKAINHRGKDVTGKLKTWDRDMVDEFAWRMWIGFAEDHWIDLDFGDQLSDVGPKDRLFLFAAGSVEYAYPESIWAANQAGVAMQPPVLERKTADGKWTKVAEIGFPAGMPRMMSFDLTGKLNGVTGPLRLRTNLQIFWDQLFLAKVVDRVPPPVKAEEHKLFRAIPLEVSSARLYARGFMQEYSPDGKLPTLYDHDRLVPTPATRLSGKLTRYGDVTELLRETDDRFVLIGPGDEAEIKFDARALPPLPKGWKRSYVLRSWGYCKDTAPFTATGDTIEPLPFRGMTTYPYGSKEKYPDTPKHREYLQRYNTRRVVP